MQIYIYILCFIYMVLYICTQHLLTRTCSRSINYYYLPKRVNTRLLRWGGKAQRRTKRKSDIHDICCRVSG